MKFFLRTAISLYLTFFVSTLSFGQRLNHGRNSITDFRYNSARIDAITILSNGSLIVISNGYYWTLDRGQLPILHNVRGQTKQLCEGFNQIDDIWIDPYNDISPQIYIASNNVEHGLKIACQEFNEHFSTESRFCHLPVDQKWNNALKDLDFSRPIDAVTWRNRTKNQDGGFWVFFQEFKMITIDPYEMNLRFTYDIRKWMSINETLTAAFYDYHQSVYHLFFDKNKYFTWTVNVPLMNSLPMSWDRAFLHGTLSQEMKINQDFFGFSKFETRDWPQPNYKKIEKNSESESINTIKYKNKSDSVKIPMSPKRPIYINEADTQKNNTNRQPQFKPNQGPYSPQDDLSDFILMTPKTKFIYSSISNREDYIKQQSDTEKINNFLENDENDLVGGYQKQMMQLNVRDFTEKRSALNGDKFKIKQIISNSILICILFLLKTIFL